MRGPERAFRNDPILQEVMRKHHLQWIDFVGRGDGTHYLPYSSNIRPAIEISLENSSAHLRIGWNVTGMRIRYEVDSEGAIITITDTVLPSTTLHGLSGEKASKVVEMPGFDRVVIEQAVLSKAFVSDPLDLRMSVHAIDEEEGAVP